MSTLQKQVIQSLNGLSEDSLKFILDMIEKFIKPVNTIKANPTAMAKVRQIGIYKPDELYAPDYDIDEDNAEIARMFGEVDT